jgi:predicted metal-dependent phosphoesterase TrpH
MATRIPNTDTSIALHGGGWAIFCAQPGDLERPLTAEEKREVEWFRGAALAKIERAHGNAGRNRY